MAINWRGVSGPNLAGATQLLNNAASGFGQSLTDLSNQVTDYSKELKNKAIDKAAGQLTQEAAQEGADLKSIHAKGVSMLMDQGASFKEAQEIASSSLNSSINLRNDAQGQEKYQHDLGRRSILEGQQDATHASNLSTNELNRANVNQLMSQRGDLHKGKLDLAKANLTKANQGIKENAIDNKTKEIDYKITNDSVLGKNAATLKSLESDFTSKTQPKINALKQEYDIGNSNAIVESLNDQSSWTDNVETYRSQMNEDFLASGNTTDYTDTIINTLSSAKISPSDKKAIVDLVGNPSNGFLLNTVNKKDLKKKILELVSAAETKVTNAKNNIKAYTSKEAELTNSYKNLKNQIDASSGKRLIEIRNKYNK